MTAATRSVVIDGERYYAESRITAALASVYPEHRIVVANICDDHLDCSGRLLGVVRDVSLDARKRESNV